MSYSGFTIDNLKETFGIKLIEDVSLFPTPPSAQTPESLAETLSRYIPVVLGIFLNECREREAFGVRWSRHRFGSDHFKFEI